MKKQEKDKIKKEVVALKYTEGENAAPQIIAMGKGEIAERIIETAKANDVPVYEDQELAHTLSKLNIGDEIPPELYSLVAEILVFVSSIDKFYGESYDSKKQV